MGLGLRALILSGALVGVGCLGADPTTQQPAGPAVVESSLDALPAVTELVAPAPALGAAWTYRLEGVWDTEREVMVVVAEAGPYGYLFAAGAEDDLPGQISWGRPWFGKRDADLNGVAEGDGQPPRVLFDFPITDGKTWTSRGAPVTARLADVRTPLGTETGGIMRSQRADDQGLWNETWEYAPGAGFLASFLLEHKGEVMYKAVLQGMGTATHWVWYEPGPRARLVAPPDRHEVIDIPAGFDAVVVSAGADAGGRVAVVAPPTAGVMAWTLEGRDAGQQETRIWPGSPGRWVLGATAPQTSEAYLRFTAVHWVVPETVT